MKFHALTGLLLSLVANTVVAGEPMTQDQCDGSWTLLADTLDLPEQDRRIEQRVTAQGWCSVESGADSIENDNFTEFRWRASQIDTALALRVPPRQLQIELDGIDLARSLGIRFAPGTDMNRGAMKLRFSHDPETRRGQIDPLEVELGGLGEIVVSAEARNIDFSDRNMMMISLGSARLEKIRFELENRGFLERLPAPGAENLKEHLAALQSILPPETLDPDSLAALEALLDDLPEALGTLHFVARSEPGLGPLQFGASVLKMQDDPAASPTESLALLLDGVTIRVSWTPQK